MTNNNGMQVFGEVGWDAPVGGFEKKGPQKDLFLKLEEGRNAIRILTLPQQYLTHRYKKDLNNKSDYGQKVNCSQIHGSCPICEMEGQQKAKRRWLVGVLDRKTNAYKIVDIGWTVFNQIKTLSEDHQYWGDPTTYDIAIVKNSKAPPASFYTVQPLVKSPLSASEQVIRDNIDMDDLRRRVLPPKAEDVLKRIARINGDEGGSFNYGANPTTTTSTKVSVKVEEDEDEGFPAYGEDAE